MTRAIAGAAHALGAAAFLWPFFLERGGASAGATAHAGDAPLLFPILGAMLLGIALADVRAGKLTVKHLAMLGVLSGVNAILRLPGSFGGASLMFILPILCGYAFGARFAFLLGASSMAASAAITGGIGPWLPFQMWALGWVGMGAAALRRPLRDASTRAAVAALAAYGWAAGFAFGLLVNLWFWPWASGAPHVSWSPGIGAADAATRYWRFYVLTSLGWDAARAAVNTALLLAVGAPVLRLLTRARDRTEAVWVEEAERAPDDPSVVALG